MSNKRFYSLIAINAVLAIGLAFVIVQNLALKKTTAKSYGALQDVAQTMRFQGQALSEIKKEAQPKNLVAVIDKEMDRRKREAMLKEYNSLKGRFSAAKKTVNGKEHVYGNPNAEVSLVEFGDYDCPFCQRFHGEPKEVVDHSDGHVNWIFKNFLIHPSAQPLHIAAECIAKYGDNRKFFIANDMIYKAGGSRSISPEKLGQMIPIDQDKYENCVQNSETQDKVSADSAFGNKAGVSGTPTTFVINNKTNKVLRLKGAVPESQIIQAVQQVLKGGGNSSNDDKTSSNGGPGHGQQPNGASNG